MWFFLHERLHFIFNNSPITVFFQFGEYQKAQHFQPWTLNNNTLSKCVKRVTVRSTKFFQFKSNDECFIWALKNAVRLHIFNTVIRCDNYKAKSMLSNPVCVKTQKKETVDTYSLFAYTRCNFNPSTKSEKSNKSSMKCIPRKSIFWIIMTNYTSGSIVCCLRLAQILFLLGTGKSIREHLFLIEV